MFDDDYDPGTEDSRAREDAADEARTLDGEECAGEGSYYGPCGTCPRCVGLDAAGDQVQGNDNVEGM